eukprot:m.65060 g.65060  ORF g.65060 m.65060 type:complete len:1150 (-) comp8265_c0_seq1:59-3508(-)
MLTPRGITPDHFRLHAEHNTKQTRDRQEARGRQRGGAMWRTTVGGVSLPDAVVVVIIGVFSVIWIAVFASENPGSANQPGRDGFAAIGFVYGVTIVGLTYVWWLRQRRFAREEEARQQRAEKKARDNRQSAWSKAKVVAVQNAANVKTRIFWLWKTARESKKAVLERTKTATRPTAFDLKHWQAVELYQAHVLTLYEAYVNLFRTYSPNAAGTAKQHPARVLRKVLPYLRRLADIGRELEAIQRRLDDDVVSMDLLVELEHRAGTVVSKAEKATATWKQLATEYPGLHRESAQGRFEQDIELNGPAMEGLEQALIKHLSFDERRVAGVVPSTPTTRANKTRWIYIPAVVFRHKTFYACLVLLYIGVMAPFFASINQGYFLGYTFLPLPPQYCLDCLPDGDGVPIQKVMIPMVFGIMHTALLSLGLLPIPLCRGLLRDFASSNEYRAWFPVEDNVGLHRLFGYLMLGALLFAPFLWLIAMGASCLGSATDNAKAQELACTAFAPLILDAVEGPLPINQDVNPRVISTVLRFDSFRGGSFFDPRDNVLFLRILAWILFYGVTPWIINRDRTYFASWIPGFLKQWWFEWATYSHYVVGYVATLCALYARFEVFFPVVVGWQLLVYNNYRELVLHTFDIGLTVGAKATENNTALIHRSDIDQKPTAVELLMPAPERFNFSAGQYLQVKIGAIDPYYHSFSLASCPSDEAIHLLIGIKGKWSKNKEDEWVQAAPTWTYKLHRMVLERAELPPHQVKPISVHVRGPYGSPFQCCYSDQYKATVLVGSGTGLTSALSVLKEVIQRRNPQNGKPKPMSDRVWFVWSCRNVRDLKWCWRTLQKALVEACATGAIDLPNDFCAATSATLGWLGVSIYVSQANKDNLLEFLGYDEVFDPTVADDSVAFRRSTEANVGQGTGSRDNSAKAATKRNTSSAKSTATVASTASKLSREENWPQDDEGEHHITMGVQRHASGVDPTALDTSIFAIVSSAREKAQAKDDDDRVGRRSSVFVSSQERNVLVSCTEALAGASKGNGASSVQDNGESMTSIVQDFLGSYQDRDAEEALARKIVAHTRNRQRIDVGAWLKEQVIASSLDSNGVHIRQLFEDLADLPDNRRRHGQGRKVAVCYCGPHGLAVSLTDICSELDIQFEYLAHAE